VTLKKLPNLSELDSPSLKQGIGALQSLF
jgi:hypothetical protein